MYEDVDLKKAIGSPTVFSKMLLQLLLYLEKTTDIEHNEKKKREKKRPLSHQALWGCISGTRVRKSPTSLGLSVFICRINGLDSTVTSDLKKSFLVLCFCMRGYLEFLLSLTWNLATLLAYQYLTWREGTKREKQRYSCLLSSFHLTVAFRISAQCEGALFWPGGGVGRCGGQDGEP